MSKFYKGKNCSYCSTPRSSTTADHVFAREFFTKNDRSNLPKVPSCEKCNNKKSQLEHYLLTVLPFGGRHPDASEMLSQYVPPRLAKNLKLKNTIVNGVERGWRNQKSGLITPEMKIPLESEKLNSLFEFVARGLSVYHWGYVIPAETIVRAGLISSAGTSIFEKLLALNGNRIQSTVGNDAFCYEGVQSVSEPQIAIWKITPYGGVQMGGDPNWPLEISTDVWVTTNPAAMKSLLDSE